MSRSPLAYPLNRAVDAEGGGAADLQTDVMRFMAILALCLVAIFALVQSIPLAPIPAPEERAEAQPPEPVATTTTAPAVPPVPPPAPAAAKDVAAPVQESVVLTRPKWTPQRTPNELPAAEPVQTPLPAVEQAPDNAIPDAPTDEGFTLRFASDAALMRAVAAHHVGVYAIEPGRARRMTVSDSRVSFWDASTPNSFHEMEPGTVPQAVAAALARSGGTSGDLKWGVTLPGRMKARLDELMAQHPGGALIIGANGNIHWETLQ